MFVHKVSIYSKWKPVHFQEPVCLALFVTHPHLPAPCPQSPTGLLQVQSAYDLLTEVGGTGPWGAESPCASP